MVYFIFTYFSCHEGVRRDSFKEISVIKSKTDFSLYSEYSSQRLYIAILVYMYIEIIFIHTYLYMLLCLDLFYSKSQQSIGFSTC